MKKPKFNLTDQQFNRWTALYYNGNRRWMCQCECGTQRLIPTARLRSGASQSCGCLRRDKKTESSSYNYIKYPREYRIWGAIKTRCLNKKSKDYLSYGGRNISICQEWINSFEVFLKDMGLPPTPHHQIDRINNDEGYSPNNCRWVTCLDNSRNRRSSKVLTYNGVSKTASEWSYDLNMSRHAVAQRLRKGWSLVDAITTPSLKKPKNKRSQTNTQQT